jgi:hypothetical protein
MQAEVCEDYPVSDKNEEAHIAPEVSFLLGILLHFVTVRVCTQYLCILTCHVMRVLIRSKI